MDFPAPIGRREVVTTLHSEVATLPRAFPTARQVTFKIAFEPGLVERFRMLSEIGLASEDPVDAGGPSVRPRDVLIALGRYIFCHGTQHGILAGWDDDLRSR